jgi:hypothetical protein
MDGSIALAREPMRRAPARSPITLTVKNVETAGPLMGRDGQKRRNEITDALVPGLRLVVQPSGAKSWAVRYHRAGRVTKMTLGPYVLPYWGARTDTRTEWSVESAGARLQRERRWPRSP